jgi:hypothetical protein
VAAKSKVYVIDPSAADMLKGRAAKRGKERSEYSPDEETSLASSPQASRTKGRHVKGPVEEQGSPLLAFLSYLAGPFAIFATRRGRESWPWVVVAILSATGAAVLFAGANRLFAAPHGSGIGFIIWLSVACVAALAGFATWARGAFLLGRHKGWLLKRLPAWLRHPGTAGALGLVIPGFGLFVAQHPRRAACALLSACATVVAALVLWHAPALWRLSQAGILVEHSEILERIFLVMGAGGALGALAWIFQALDGARLAGDRTEGTSVRHGDRAAAALVIAIAALLVTFQPARVAETIDRFGVSLRADGLRVIPLVAAETAMRLDPSRPEYAMRAMDLNEELGRTYRAEVLRCYLEDRWQPYERMLRLEAASVAEIPVHGPDEP